MVKAVGHLEKSTEVMAAVNDLIKIPEITQAMQEMSKEMIKVCKLMWHKMLMSM